MKLAKIVKHCRIDKPDKFKLADFDPAESFGLPTDIEDVRAILADGVARLEDMQERLYAHGRWAVLIVLQGMDAAGKDGVIKHVMTGINPVGCSVHSFKAPSAEEIAHNFLWRIDKYLPQRGHIGIFNRSHYEEVLAVRVHPELLERQNLPLGATGKNIWKHRQQDIRGFERHLTRNGTLVLKFHLRISKQEQRKRFLARLDEPSKRWKFSANDIAERAYWDDYMAAYEDMIRETSTGHAPWYVIPADHKHVAWMIVSTAIIEAIAALKPQFPKVAGQALKDLKKAERTLRAEDK
ncbi:MAG: polyphosphate kinase 2 family protein [Xanthobacteraceae bacterium]